MIFGSFFRNENGRLVQFHVVFSATLATTSLGIIQGWPSPSIPRLIDKNGDYKFTIEEASYLTIVPCVAMALISPLLPVLDRRFRRKHLIFLTEILALAALLTWAFSKSIYVFHLGSIFYGLSMGFFNTSVPTYMGETLRPDTRADWNVATYFGQTLGLLLINVVGGYLKIRDSALICACAPMAALIAFAFAPESPYCHLMRGENEKAIRCLGRLRGNAMVGEEFSRLQDSLRDAVSTTQASWGEVFKDPTNRKALVMGVFAKIARHLVAYPPLVVYNQYIFGVVAKDLGGTLSSIIFNSSALIAGLACLPLLRRTTNRAAMVASFAGCALALAFETGYFYAAEHLQLAGPSWLPLAGLVVYLAFFQMGAGTVGDAIVGEIFALKFKAKDLCLASVATALALGLSLKVFQVLQTECGFAAAFGCFGLASLAGAVAALFLVPETKGMTLEEIQREMAGSGRS